MKLRIGLAGLFISLIVTATAQAQLYVRVKWTRQSVTNIGSEAEAEYFSGTLTVTRDYNWYIYLDNDIDGPRSATRWKSAYGYVKVGAGISEMLPGYRLPAGCYRSTASGEAHKDGQTATQSASTSEYCISAPTGPGGGGDLETCDHCDGSNIEPLVLDLNGDGIWTTSKDGGAVWFDLNGNGLPDLTAWTSGDHEDAFLYFDWNDNKTIDGGQELFGDATILPDGRRASHGYEALAAYDDPEFGGNADGVISRADAVWTRLRLWVDRNHDAMVSNDENSTLAAAGVVELSLAYVQMTAAENYGLDANGNRHLYQGSFAQKVRGETHRQSMHELYFVADLH